MSKHELEYDPDYFVELRPVTGYNENVMEEGEMLSEEQLEELWGDQYDKIEPRCPHREYAYIKRSNNPAIGDEYVVINFNYCPICGEKL